jgi:integrase
MEIFRKYKQMPNMLPKSISNQKFNAYLKEVCQIAGLEETGRLEGSPEKALWETVSTHTARRSFATNLYNEGFPIFDLMRITDHKTEKSFRSYIKVTETDAAKRLSNHNKQKNWSAFLLRVAS